jgi:hypothetical protein
MTRIYSFQKYKERKTKIIRLPHPWGKARPALAGARGAEDSKDMRGNAKEMRMKGKIKKLMTWILPAALLLSCATTRVSRVQADSTMDLSGRWNDTDSRLVAEQMVKDCLSQRWLHDYRNTQKTPAVIVGKIANKSYEHISVETFVKDVERALLNSGKVEFVAGKTERKQLREEKADQSHHASVRTAKSMGEEYGADLMLIGRINSIVDKEGGKAVVFYQVDMELIELESNMKKWMGNKKIKKYVKQGSVKF